MPQRVAGQQASAPSEPEADDASPAVAVPTAGTGLKPGGGWRIPPIATSGSLAYDLRAAHGPAEARSTEHLLTATLNGASYFYQPWFARVSGSLGLTVGRSTGSGEEHGTSQQFATGAVRMDLFPRSRFPFEVHYEVNDSRIDSGSPGTFDYRARTLGIAQRYRPLDGSYNLNASAERRVFDSAGSHDTLDSLVADFNTHWKHNELSLGGSQSRGHRELTDDRSLFRSVVGRHHYSPGSEMSVDTTVNWSHTDDRLQTFANDVALLQWSSVGVWHPEGRPWTLTGSARAMQLRDEISGLTTEDAGVSLGAIYELGKHVRVSANGSFSSVHSGDTVTTSQVGSLGATYQGDSIDLRGFRYDWFGAASVSASHAGEQHETTEGLQVGHTVTRAWQLGEQSTLGLNFGQSVNATYGQQTPPPEPGSARLDTKLFVNNASLSWNSTGTDRSGYARLSYSDSAEIGGAHSRFQLLNFQMSGNLELDRNRTLTGDLTLQWSRQRAGDAFDPGLEVIVPGVPLHSASRSGEITYREARVLGVPRLAFTSKLRLAQDVLNQPGTLAVIPDRETRLWENRLDWNVGRLETQLVLRLSWIDGARRDLLMWRLQRTFGP